MGFVPCHIGLCFWGSAYCNPSVKNQRFLPAPFGKGAFGFSLLRTYIISLSKYQPSIYASHHPPKCKDTPGMHKAYRGFMYSSKGSDLTSTLKFHV